MAKGFVESEVPIAVFLQDGLQIDETVLHISWETKFSEKCRDSPFLVAHAVDIWSEVDDTAYTYMPRHRWLC